MTTDELKSLAHHTEQSRFILTLFVLVPIIILLSLVVLFTDGMALLGIIFFVPLVLFILWFRLRLNIARFINNTVQVGEYCFPEIHNAIGNAKAHFGYTKPIEAYVYEEGSYNIGILALLGRKFIMVNSELLVDNPNPNEIRYLVGRFVGALASKHYRFGWLEIFINSVENLIIFNLLLMPYERAVQYSGDQLGLDFVDGDVASAVNVMTKLMVGKDVAEQVDHISLIMQGQEYKGGFFSWWARALSGFPHVIARIENLLKFGNKRYSKDPNSVFEEIKSRNAAAKRSR